ncbi:hypothetical protein ABFS82_13G159400 [Erythranthe guttata]|uniref:Pectinesterase n=1 Tax=Erythranthe guttata TaxID=4155 RepID=A0A022QFG4_ERYGU|nr:PREDICTED: pectinesterase QRT1-like [Erythranthe guttata]EYU27427.1 hypothetical protein MIMGU_mgv1a025315mg [Erythranthe guttata]|eukprot:XP_012848362.1 PREDICTED: pectinesterase QRT1-like [Erythranthe guttata]
MSLCFLVILVFLLGSEAKAGFTPSNGNGSTNYNYITWNDFKVDYHDHGRLLPVGDSVNLDKVIIVVDKNGSGDSFTVQGAVDMVREHNAHRVKIHILPGVYREKVRIPRNKPYISFIGEQNRASETVITWHDKAGDRDSDAGDLGTQRSASVTVESDFFVASWITFQNTIVARPGIIGAQAVALRIAGEKAVFYEARFLGSQDTLLDEGGTHYFYRCFIQGSTDFVFGNAKSLYQECDISVVGRGFAVAAHHRNTAAEETGFSFVNCTVRGTGVVYLGRAWGEYSRIVYSQSDFNIRVKPRGWDDWRKPSRRKTVMFGEYKCRGRGANRRRRARWSKSLSYSEARPFLDKNFINGDQWLRL